VTFFVGAAAKFHPAGLAGLGRPREDVGGKLPWQGLWPASPGCVPVRAKAKPEDVFAWIL